MLRGTPLSHRVRMQGVLRDDPGLTQHPPLLHHMLYGLQGQPLMISGQLHAASWASGVCETHVAVAYVDQQL